MLQNLSKMKQNRAFCFASSVDILKVGQIILEVTKVITAPPEGIVTKCHGSQSVKIFHLLVWHNNSTFNRSGCSDLGLWSEVVDRTIAICRAICKARAKKAGQWRQTKGEGEAGEVEIKQCRWAQLQLYKPDLTSHPIMRRSMWSPLNVSVRLHLCMRLWCDCGICRLHVFVFETLPTVLLGRWLIERVWQSWAPCSVHLLYIYSS